MKKKVIRYNLIRLIENPGYIKVENGHQLVSSYTDRGKEIRKQVEEFIEKLIKENNRYNLQDLALIIHEAIGYPIAFANAKRGIRSLKLK